MRIIVTHRPEPSVSFVALPNTISWGQNPMSAYGTTETSRGWLRIPLATAKRKCRDSGRGLGLTRSELRNHLATTFASSSDHLAARATGLGGIVRPTPLQPLEHA